MRDLIVQADMVGELGGEMGRRSICHNDYLDRHLNNTGCFKITVKSKRRRIRYGNNNVLARQKYF